MDNGNEEAQRHLYLIRHAQSANNALADEERVPDPGLTPLGHLQAMRLAVRLRGFSIQQIYCSGFLRALETARYLAAAKQMIPHVRQDIFEQGGCYAGFRKGEFVPNPGMGRSEIAKRYPKWEIDSRISDAGWWTGQNYEDESEAMQRADLVAAWLRKKALVQHPRVALVIHGDFKRLLLNSLIGGPLAELDPPNTSITHLVFDRERWQHRIWYCVDHLVPELVT